jgi:hypothetical protein
MSPKIFGQTWLRFIGRFCVLLTEIVAGGLIAPLSAQGASASLTVNMNTVIQNDFLGVNAVYHGFAFMPEQIDKGMNDADRAREFDRVQRIGLNIARTWYHPNYACSASLWDTCDWNSTRMQALYSWLQTMKDRNVDVALQLGWWFTRDTYYGRTSPDPDADPQNFAAWVSESLHQIIEVKGFTNVKYGILFTEPTGYESGTVPSGYSQWSYYVKMVKAIHTQLVTDGRRSLVKLVGPNNCCGAVHLSSAVSELNNEIDIYSGHDYNYADYSGWSNLCNNMKNTVAATGKPFWLDEWGKQDEFYRQTGDYGNYVAQGVAACLNAGVQTPMNWILFDQQYISTDSTVGNTWDGSDSFYNGIHRWGFAKWPHDTIANPTLPYPSWYAFSLMSKYLGGRAGTQVYQTTNANGTYIAAVKRSSGDWSFLVVNGNASATSIQVALSSPLNHTLYRYLYDPAQIVPTEAADLIAADIRLPNVGASFTDSLPARGVAIYSTIGKPVLTFFPQVAVGNGYSTTFTLGNTGATPISGNLLLTDQQGNPFTVNSTNFGAGSSFPVSIPPGGTTFLTVNSPNANDPQKSGWATIETPGGSLGGVATFEFAAQGVMQAAAGVLPSQQMQFATIPVDNDDSQIRFTGYALANPSDQSLVVKLGIVDQDGNLVDDTITITLGPRQQIARFLHQDLNRLKFRGSMVFRAQAGGTFVVVALLQKQQLFTVIPVIPAKAPHIPN